jgi:16S rRNA (guanine1516-N2)-methyltransferase
MHRIGLSADSSAQKEILNQLSKQLNIPVRNQSDNYEFLLHLSAQRLEIQHSLSSKPFWIDFTSADMARRTDKSKLNHEPLLKATGITKQKGLSIIDTTCGLGRETFILAAAGCNVISLERSPIVHALLEDALRRGKQNTQTSEILERVDIIHADAKNFFSTFNNKVDVVYIDPMHPPRRKQSALVKLNMRILRALVGEDNDANQLLLLALKAARKRVVVKLPVHAEPLDNQTPSFSQTGKATRYDVYLR